MTQLALAALDTALTVAAPAPTQLVAALDPPLVLEVAPSGATLAVTASQAGVLTAPAAQGPDGPPGPKGDAGPAGPAGGNRTYAFTFAAAATWDIVHGLGRYPSVTTLDTAGEQFRAEVTYPDANTVRVACSVPVAGTAYLN